MAKTKRSEKQKKESEKKAKALKEIVKYIPDEPFDENDPAHDEYIKRDNYKSSQTPNGRPTVMTKQVLLKLEFAFKLGAHDRLACIFAGIAMSTLYEYCKKHPEFSEQKEDFKASNEFNSLRNISMSIAAGNLADSWAYLEKKNRKEWGNAKEAPEDERAYTIDELEAIAKGEYTVQQLKAHDGQK